MDWTTFAVTLASTIVTILLHARLTAPASSSTPATTPADAIAVAPAASAPVSRGLFGHGGLFHRQTAPAAPSTSPPAAAPSATPVVSSHPILSSLVTTLENQVQQNPQLLQNLLGATVNLVQPNGTTAINVGTTSAPTAAAPSPATAGS